MKVEVINTLAYYGKNLITTVKRFVRKDSLSQLALIYYLGLFTTSQLFKRPFTENTNIYKYIQTYLQLQKLLKMPSLFRLGLIKTVC
jgi:hypothetical protein